MKVEKIKNKNLKNSLNIKNIIKYIMSGEDVVDNSKILLMIPESAGPGLGPGPGPGPGPGSGLDPYVVTLDNQVYKMNNFDGYARMLQGTINNKLLTINAELKMNDHNKADISNNYVKQNLNKFQNKNLDCTNFLNCDYEDHENSFYTKLYIQLEDQNLIIDMENLNTIENKSNFDIIENIDLPSFSQNFKYYKNISEKKILIKVDSIEILISYSKNPQIRSSFNIFNSNNIKNTSGALSHKLYSKDLKIKSLKDIKPLKRKINRKNYKKKVTEIFINNNGQEYTQSFEIY